MASKTTKVKIKVEADTKKATKNLDSIGRAQTRLGQASASAGRQFSAQANGLGGLVAAYAGAAANVFALQQAFAALQRAAQFDQLLAGTDTLAAAVATTGQEVLTTMRQIAKGQLTIAEAAKTANIALSAGFNIDQISALTDVSLKASRALGRDFNDALTRLSRGAAKLEPELLDELGIFTRIEPAVNKYALSVGKTAAQLTSFERRQAFANSIIEEGTRKFGNVNTIIPTTAEKFEQLSASLIDLATQVGSFLAERLVPLAEFFTENLLAKIVVFGAISKVILGTGLGLLGTKVASTFAFMGNAVNVFLGTLSKIGPSVKKQSAALDQMGKGLKGVSLTRLTAKGKEDISPLVKQARGGELGVAGTLRLQAALKSESKILKDRRKEIDRQIVKAGGLTKATKTLTAAYRSNEAAQNNLRRAMRLTTVAMGRMGKVAAIVGPTILRLEKGVKALAIAFRWLGRAIRIVSTAILVLSAGAAAIAEFTGYAQALNNLLIAFGNLFEGVFGKRASKEALDGIAGVTNELIKQHDILKKINKEVTVKPPSIFGWQADDFKRTIDEDKTGKILNEVVAKAIGDIDPNNPKIAKAIKSANKALLQSLFGSIDRKDVKGEMLKILTAFEEVAEEAIKRGQGAEALGQLGKIIGRSAGAILKDFTAATDKAGEIKITAKDEGGLVTQALFGSYDPAGVGKGVEQVFYVANKGSKELASILARQVQVQQSFLDGTTSIENAQKDRAELEKRIKDFLAIEDKILTIQNKNLIKQLLIGQQRLATQTDGVTALDNQRKIIERLFGTEIKRAQNLTGFMNDEFELAKDSKEERANKLKDLGKIVSLTKDQVALSKTDAILTEEQQVSSQLGVKAQQALIGGYIKTREAIKKINEELEKRVKLLTDKRVVLAIQQELKLNKQIAAANKAAQALRDARVTIEDAKRVRIRELADLEIDRIRAVADAMNNSFQTVLDSPAGALFSAGEKREFVLKIATENYERLVNDQQRLVDRQQEDTKATIAAIDQQIKDNVINDLHRENFARLEKKIAVARIDAQKATNTLQLDLMKERVNILKDEAKIFNSHLEGLAYILAADRVDREIAMETARQGGDAGAVRQELGKRFGVSEVELTRGGPAQKTAAEFRSDLVKALTKKIKPKIEPLDVGTGIKEYADSVTALNITLEEGKDLLDNESRKRKVLMEDAKRDEELADKRAEATHKLKVAQLGQTQAVLDAKNALDDLRKAAELAGNKWLKVAVTFVESFGQNALSSLNDLFTAMREGTLTMQNLKEGFQSFILSIVEDVQSTITEEFIVKPMKDFLATQLRGLFGLGTPAASPEVQATEAVKSSVDLVTEKVGSSAEMICQCIKRESKAAVEQKVKSVSRDDGGNGEGQAITEKSAEASVAIDELTTDLGWFGQMAKNGGEDITSAGNLISQGFDGILNNTGSFSSNLGSIFQGAFQGIVGLGKSILGGIGSALFGSGTGSGGLLGGIFSFFSGSASGGIVQQKMAAGGQLRDRVPALLEPGEFVIRRPMAKAIGGPALHAMNKYRCETYAKD